MPKPSIHHQDSGAGTLVRMDYGYNAVHDRTYERFGASGASGEAFEYDKMRRLTKAWMGSSTPSSPSGQPHTEVIDFNMDDDGNRTSNVHTPYLGSPASTSYTTNSLNQYTAVGAASLTYDGNGNLVDDGTYYYEYDYRNQLIEVGHSGGAVIATYRYDAMGRRVEKNVQGPGITRFILSGANVVGTCAGQSTWTESFVYAEAIDSIVAVRKADVLDWDSDLDTVELAWNYYHLNAIGSVMFISEPDETEAVTIRYSPYGEASRSRGGVPQGADPLGQDIAFAGLWESSECGLYYCRARQYSPSLGRFLSHDPVGLFVGPNLYEYCISAPTTRTDRTGLAPKGEGYERKMPDNVESVLKDLNVRYSKRGTPPPSLTEINRRFESTFGGRFDEAASFQFWSDERTKARLTIACPCAISKGPPDGRKSNSCQPGWMELTHVETYKLETTATFTRMRVGPGCVDPLELKHQMLQGVAGLLGVEGGLALLAGCGELMTPVGWGATWVQLVVGGTNVGDITTPRWSPWFMRVSQQETANNASWSITKPCSLSYAPSQKAVEAGRASAGPGFLPGMTVCDVAKYSVR